MDSSYSFYLAYSKEEYETLKDDFDESQSLIDKTNGIINDYTDDIINSVKTLVEDINNGKIKENDASGKSLIDPDHIKDLFKKDMERRSNRIAEQKKINENHERIKKNLRLARRKFEIMTGMGRIAGRTTEVSRSNLFNSIFNASKIDSGTSDSELKDKTSKLWKFIEDNNNEVPEFVRDYMLVWVSEVEDASRKR